MSEPTTRDPTKNPRHQARFEMLKSQLEGFGSGNLPLSLCAKLQPFIERGFSTGNVMLDGWILASVVDDVPPNTPIKTHGFKV